MGSEEDSSASAGAIIGLVLRTVFIGGKCMLLIIKTFQVSCRYYRTYDTILQFEIWYFLLSGMKVLILLPCILVRFNINYLFTMFVLNSLMNNISNYHMHSKANYAMYNTENSINFSLLFAFRLFALFIVVMWAMYPHFGLSCEQPDPYPDQLAAVMYLDFFNGTTDLIITFRLPKNLTRIKEQRRRAGSILGGLDSQDNQ